VVGSDGRLGCANHRQRGTCDNRPSALRATLSARVMEGLKRRLLAPDLVEQFVASYLAEVKIGNRDRGQRQAQLGQEQARVARQVRNLVKLAKEGGATRATLDELRALESRQDELARDIATAGEPEKLPALHPNLPLVDRQTVEQLEGALRDPAPRQRRPRLHGC